MHQLLHVDCVGEACEAEGSYRQVPPIGMIDLVQEADTTDSNYGPALGHHGYPDNRVNKHLYLPV